MSMNDWCNSPVLIVRTASPNCEMQIGPMVVVARRGLIFLAPTPEGWEEPVEFISLAEALRLRNEFSGLSPSEDLEARDEIIRASDCRPHDFPGLRVHYPSVYAIWGGDGKF